MTIKKILIVRLSSLGDVIHTFPAVTELKNNVSNAEIHWLVEESFGSLVEQHPFVSKVITCRLRSWKKSPFKKKSWKEFKAVIQQLKNEKYDQIIDSQGLLKSTLFTLFIKAPSYGYDRRCCREPICSLFYNHTFHIPYKEHAIERNKILFAKALKYSSNSQKDEYGLQFKNKPQSKKTVFLFHGTARDTKKWPTLHWKAVSDELIKKGYKIYLPAGNDQELKSAKQIQSNKDEITILFRESFQKLIEVMRDCQFVIGVDTGLLHLAAALDKPSITIYGPTSFKRYHPKGDQHQFISNFEDCFCKTPKRCLHKNDNNDSYCMNIVKPQDVLKLIEVEG